MQGDEKVIDYLNKALTNELTAINQYWLHYRVLNDWGVYKLAEYERHESIDEMKHADWLADRILFLNGLPNFQAIHKLKVGETVEEILKADLALEHEAIPLLREAADYCQEVKGYCREAEDYCREAKSYCRETNDYCREAARRQKVNFAKFQMSTTDGFV